MAFPVLKQPASPNPTRFTSGITSDPPYGPLAASGGGNPAFYHQFFDDFDTFMADKFAGTATAVAGDGGLVTVAGVLQAASAGFVLPATGASPPASATGGKKMFYLARLTFATAATASFLAGFAAAGTTFTGAATGLNGLCIYKAAGGGVFLVNGASTAGSPSGVAFNIQIPLDPTLVAMSLVNNQSFDVAIEIDHNQNVFGYIAPQLVGWFPQAGTGGPFAPDGSPTSIVPVKARAVSNYNWIAQATGMAGNVATPMMFSTSALAPTIAATTGAAATVDFLLGQKER
jgi:hypothetical protein